MGKSIPITNPATRYDLGLVNIQHSSTSLTKGTTRYTTYHFASIVSVDRSGLVKVFKIAGSTLPRNMDNATTITIAHLADCRRLAGNPKLTADDILTTEFASREFANVDDGREALLAYLESLKNPK